MGLNTRNLKYLTVLDFLIFKNLLLLKKSAYNVTGIISNVVKINIPGFEKQSFILHSNIFNFHLTLNNFNLIIC